MDFSRGTRDFRSKARIAFEAVYRYRNGAVTELQPAIFYGNDTAIRRAAPMENVADKRGGLWVNAKMQRLLKDYKPYGRRNPLGGTESILAYSLGKFFFRRRCVLRD